MYPYGVLYTEDGIKKESPNKGTETFHTFSEKKNADPIKKESPNKGTETVLHRKR